MRLRTRINKSIMTDFPELSLDPNQEVINEIYARRPRRRRFLFHIPRLCHRSDVSN